MSTILKFLTPTATIAACSLINSASGYGYSIEPISVDVPEDSEKSCQEAIDSVRVELAR